MFPRLSVFLDLGIVLRRLMVRVISAPADSPPEESRRASSKERTIFLGAAGIAGALGVAAGVLTPAAAFGLILVMLGAIEKKVSVWHSGFWGQKGEGWHCEWMLDPDQPGDCLQRRRQVRADEIDPRS